MAKEAGEIVRYEPAPEPLSVAAAIVVLAALDAIFVLLFLWGSFVAKWNTPVDQQVLAFWLANVFAITAVILVLYRRFFLPDLLIVKKRRKKFEDF
ncbi:MAG TPA: hypothetical protein VM681_05205 [Candidatus Thermoplasmatota archaeon]|nr:hypothetical protein [Candidatus Thermoplasmatota archaeon]